MRNLKDKYSHVKKDAGARTELEECVLIAWTGTQVLAEAAGKTLVLTLPSPQLAAAHRPAPTHSPERLRVRPGPGRTPLQNSWTL